jgi:hypothetical protein
MPGRLCNIYYFMLFESVECLKLCYFVSIMVLLDHFSQVPESVFPIYLTRIPFVSVCLSWRSTFESQKGSSKHIVLRIQIQVSE